jgi:hypothetical protein
MLNPDQCSGTGAGQQPHGSEQPARPQHRVIGKDKTMHGYAGGLRRKIYLLELEANKELPKQTVLLPSSIKAKLIT